MTGSSALRLVLDQGVPRDAAASLRGLGFECMHVGEIGMSKSEDNEILAWALGRNAIVVTLDADFHAILAVSGAGAPSVIRVRIQGLGASAVVELVQQNTRQIRRRSQARMSGHGEGKQGNVSPAADRRLPKRPNRRISPALMRTPPSVLHYFLMASVTLARHHHHTSTRRALQ